MVRAGEGHRRGLEVPGTGPATATVDAEQFREAMRLTASGVAIITTDGAAGRAGLTVSTLCSLSMDPPSVIVCVHRHNRALGTLLENGCFAANVLAEGHVQVANVFAGLVAHWRDDRFGIGEWVPLATGAPSLADAVCSFDCRVAGVHDHGSHRILIGEVVSLTTRPDRPLVFSNRGYRQLAAI